MQKPTVRTFLLGFITIGASYIYLTANTTIPQTVIIKEAPVLESALEERRTLNYLNRLRIGAGLIPLSHNDKLKKAADNHAQYLIANDKIGHYEEQHLKGYTGTYGSERSVHVGYQTPMVIENISSNNFNYKESVDGLMAAIYHRFGFLDFHIDEIGIAVQQNAMQKDKTAFVYDMGSKPLAKLCESSTETKKAHADDQLDNICADPFVSVSKASFHNAIQSHCLNEDDLISAGKHILVAYTMEPASGYGYLETAAHFAAESSTGTNVEVSTTDDFTKGVDALVYEIDEAKGIMKIAYPNELFDRNV
ncbi:MAG TPA: hypothetical protein ENK86_07215, partial [Campylobacterales bacterium]|nr:hypothetical protein [Campylobacterales bacterium]